MARTIINTVGISSLLNAARAQNQKPDACADLETLTRFLAGADEVSASAETNALSRIIVSDDHLVFLHSQTPQGEVCAQALARHYQAGGHPTELRAIPHLDYSEARFKNRGLRSLVAVLCEIIGREREAGRTVAINATGGFKGEISYATVVALLLDVPLFYIHEAFRDIVEMPPIPISWDYSLIAWNEEFFNWLEADLRSTDEVEQRLHGVSPQVRVLLAEEDGYTLLSPAGEAFFAAFQVLMRENAPQKIQLSAQARRQWDAMSPSLQGEVGQLLQKISVDGLRAMSSHMIKPSSDCLSFPTGHNANRILFYDEDERVMVCELISHYDASYERAYERGIWRRNYADFASWSGI